MTDEIEPGVKHTFTYTVPESKLIARLFPESAEFNEMPEVLASGFYIGLIEWACIELLEPHLDWPTEQTVGTHFDISHEAPTPAGLIVTIHVEVTEVNGREITLNVTAEDDAGRIGGGTHKRFIVDRDRFDETVAGRLSA